MKRKSFEEQIKDPRWQKRRLEIMQRDEFTCQMCGDKESTLHVHHIKYVSGRNYWEYNDWEMITLCAECHSAEHSAKVDFINGIISDLNSIGLMYIEILGALEEIFHLSLGDSSVDGKTLSEIFGKKLSGYVIGDIENIEKWRNKIRQK